MGLLRSEKRAITYQDYFGTGATPVQTSQYDGRESLELSAVSGCTRIRAGLFAQMPMQAYTSDADGNPVLLAKSFIDRPSSISVPAVWKAQMSIARDLWGNAPGIITGFDAAGYPNGVDWLPPWRWSAIQSVISGPLQHYIDGQPIDADKILLVPSMYVMPGTPMGMAPLEAGGLVDIGKRAQEFGRDWFTNGAVPATTVQVDGTLNQDESNDLRDRVIKAWRNRKPAVIGSGVTITHNKITGEESQFLETMRHVQVDICQKMGVPPEALGIASAGSSVTYQNREDAMQNMLVTGFNGDLAVVQDTFSDNMPRTQFTRFNTGALLRTDLLTRYQAYKLGLDPAAPFLQLDEVRGWENLPKWTPPPVVETITVTDRA